MANRVFTKVQIMKLLREKHMTIINVQDLEEHTEYYLEVIGERLKAPSAYERRKMGADADFSVVMRKVFCAVPSCIITEPELVDFCLKRLEASFHKREGLTLRPRFTREAGVA